MPTADRHKWAQEAVDMFRRQTWPWKELVIVDDGKVPFAPALDSEIRLIRLRSKHSIGCKRNVAVAAARGLVVCHWDDDDIYADTRIEDQVTRLMEHDAMVTGYHTMNFQMEDGSLWQYAAHRPDYAIGVSLMYRREYWERHGGFDDKSVGEDTSFCFQGAVCAPANDLIIARGHAGNTAPKAQAAIDHNQAAQKHWTRIL